MACSARQIEFQNMDRKQIKDNNVKVLANKRFELRLTDIQLEKLEFKAAQAYLKKSEFIIRLIEEREINQPLSKQELIVLTGVANNLNQLTRFAHLGNLNVDAIIEIVQKLKLVLC